MGSQRLRDVPPWLVQCWASVADNGPTFNQPWRNVSHLLGCVNLIFFLLPLLWFVRSWCLYTPISYMAFQLFQLLYQSFSCILILSQPYMVCILIYVVKVGGNLTTDLIGPLRRWHDAVGHQANTETTPFVGWKLRLTTDDQTMSAMTWSRTRKPTTLAQCCMNAGPASDTLAWR